MPASVTSSEQSSSSRGQRDWFLYRESRNALEFMAQVFGYFATTA